MSALTTWIAMILYRLSRLFWFSPCFVTRRTVDDQSDQILDPLPPPPMPPTPPSPSSGRKKRKRAGRKADPQSKRQVLKATRKSRKALKSAYMLSLEGCTWGLSKCGAQRQDNHNGCCSETDCKTTYCPTSHHDHAPLVGSLRRYYAALSDKDKRQFTADRTVYHGYSIPPEQEIRKGQQLYNYQMEHPDELWEHLRKVDRQPGPAFHARSAPSGCRAFARRG